MPRRGAVEPVVARMRADARRNRERIPCPPRARRSASTAPRRRWTRSRAAPASASARSTATSRLRTRHRRAREDQAERLRRARASEFEKDERPWESFADLIREQAEIAARDAAQQRMIFAMTHEALEQARPTIAERPRPTA